MEEIRIVNRSMELAQCRDSWTFNESYRCWCLEDVCYTPVALVPRFQRLSLYVPEAYLNPDGTVNPAGEMGPYTARTAPVVFENTCGGYMQTPPTRLGTPRCCAGQYLERGFLYVTCGSRGRESRDEGGRLVGKAPATLVDLKTAIRFLRHNRGALPGDWNRLISVGCSAGGAMSSLLGVSGDAPAFRPYLEENGAFSGESDRVFAAQIYCPIVDLEHADLAYEWMFRADKQCESSHAGPAEVMSPFKEALSRELASRYVDYFNGLGLRHPETGAALTLDPGGRSGPGYDYLMDCLNASATDYLTRRAQGRLPAGEEAFPTGREPWLTWDGTRARISDLDSYVLGYRRRMKPCTSFDKLEMDSGENQELGTRERDYVHFSPAIAGALEAIKDRFPGAYDRYHGAFAALAGDRALAERVRLLNPLSFIGTGVESRQAEHYRIRVGSRDADTALSVSMTLALKLANAACGTVDYAIVWGQPHCQADYPGEVCDWIDRICRR